MADAIGSTLGSQGWYERNRLALEFLQGLERADFPMSSTQNQVCESAAMLLQAGLIQGEVHEDQRMAVIWGLTEVGREFFSRRRGKAGTAPHCPVAPQRPAVASWVTKRPLVSQPRAA